MRRHRSLASHFVVGAVALACGCTRPSPTARESSPSLPTAAAIPAPAAAPADAGSPACASLAARYRAAWQIPARACTTAADCACRFTDLVAACAQAVAGPGPAAPLASLADAFRAQGCPDHALECSPYRCVAICANGRCANDDDAPRRPAP